MVTNKNLKAQGNCPICGNAQKKSNCKIDLNTGNVLCRIDRNRAFGDCHNGYVAIKETGEFMTWKPSHKFERNGHSNQKSNTEPYIEPIHFNVESLINGNGHTPIPESAPITEPVTEPAITPISNRADRIAAMQWLMLQLTQPDGKPILTDWAIEVLKKRGIPEELWGCFRAVSPKVTLSIPEEHQGHLPGAKNGEWKGGTLFKNDAGEWEFCNRIMIPIHTLDGAIVGAQWHNLSGTKYTWMSNQENSMHVDGEPPMQYFNLTNKPWSEANVIAICEGTGYKPLILAHRLGVPVIGAAGGQWVSSPKQWDLIFEQCKGAHFLLYPDSGWAIAEANNDKGLMINSVCQRMANLAELFKKHPSKPRLSVVNWGQGKGEKKSPQTGDCDEVDVIQLREATQLKSRIFADQIKIWNKEIKKQKVASAGYTRLKKEITQVDMDVYLPESCSILEDKYGWGGYDNLINFLMHLPSQLDWLNHEAAFLTLCGLYLPQKPLADVIVASAVAKHPNDNAAQKQSEIIISNQIIELTEQVINELMAKDRFEPWHFEQVAGFCGQVAQEISQATPKWADKLKLSSLGDRLRFNQLKQRFELDDVPEQTHHLRDILETNEGFIFKTKNISECELNIQAQARRKQYHPVKEYLEQVHAQHKDNLIDLDTLASVLFGVEDAIYCEYLKRFLIGAVARVFEPGCQMDNAFILQGEQGEKKSTFFSILASKEFFCNSMGEDPSLADEKIKMHTSWITEWAELENILNKKAISAIKAFVTCQTDMFRVPYGRETIAYPRASVIVGSTNKDEFLADPTGDRRFWVVPVQFVNIEFVQEHRDRIWASAKDCYLKGERWWLDKAVEVKQKEVNEQFATQHPLTDHILEYANQFELITVNHVLVEALNKIPTDLQKRDAMAVADILRRAGFKKKQMMVNSVKGIYWSHPDNQGKPLPNKTPQVGTQSITPLFTMTDPPSFN